MARDIDLALMGLLPAGQLLGGPVTDDDPPCTGPVPRQAAVVSIDVPMTVANAARRHGTLVLRDQELTPLARLDVRGMRTEAGQTFTRSTVLTGELSRLRERESGMSRRPETSELCTGKGGGLVVVLERPPLPPDIPTVEQMLERAEGVKAVRIVVADDPNAAVPPELMRDLAELWISHLGQSPVSVTSAPLGWRDADSNRALARRLGAHMSADTTLHLDPDDNSDGSVMWAAVRHELEFGLDNGASAQLPVAVHARLRRWRRPRAERGLVVMFTGLSGSGKSTLARDLSAWITRESDRTVTLLDGDVVRTMLSSELGFAPADRELNVRRIGYVAAEIARHGGIAICAPIAPYAATREAVRAMSQPVGDFILVHVNTSLEECERRDLKGLYAKARAGLIPDFTGISAPYESPTDADLVLSTERATREHALEEVVALMRNGGWVAPRPPSTSQGDD